jgi:hypothetical protein
LSPLGWILVLLPFIVAIIGVIVATVKKVDNSIITKDVMS